jgi:hypothetical protein
MLRHSSLGLCCAFLVAVLSASQARAQTWLETARLMQPQPGPVDRFGWSVAVEGDWLIVGAMEEQHVYVYARNGAAWDLRQEIAAPPGSNSYASSLAIDGDRFVVGAPSSFGSTGRAWVYARNGTTWSLEATLSGADIVTPADFGQSVAIEGDRVVVGAPRYSDLAFYGGAAYVFERTGSAWVQTAKLLDAAGTPYDQFGEGLALQGETILVGAMDDDGITGASGAIHVFSHSATGWTQGQKLFPAEPTAGSDFGGAIAIDGDEFVACSDFGRAYVFRNVGGTWVEDAQLSGSQVGPGGATFGLAVALEGDRAVVGSLLDDSFAGAAYVFAFDGATWSQEARLALPDGAAMDFFGCSLALQGDELFVGAWGRDGAGTWSGLLSAFERRESAGASYCAGDGNAGPCPCANESAAPLGQGCRHSGGYGATLVSVNSDSVATDDMHCVAAGMLANTTALLGAGPQIASAQSGFPFGGDGLRCIAGPVRRLGARAIGSFGSAEWGPGLALAQGFAAGETWNFQVWYRDPLGSPCGNAFNTTNAVRVTWAP